MYGHQGKILHVDLTHASAWEEPLAEEVLHAFIGGIGLGTYLLYRECPPNVDPLGPDAPLIFVTSPFVATSITTSAKYAVMAKSPLTGFIGDSLSSSHLAVELKRTGYDALVLHGACKAWSVLEITDGEIALHPADSVLGLDTRAAEIALRKSWPNYRVATIGPAGEHQVKFATICNDGRHAGRTGTGAVMGSKRLKAICVRGTHPVRVADRAGLREMNARLIERSTGPATSKYRQLGTPANLLAFDRLGVLPTLNFQQTTFDGAERLSGEELHATHLSKVVACASCTVGCEHLYRTFDAADDAEATRLEYETLFALGPMLGVSDPNAVIRLARQCDLLGLDTISAGGTLAWAMECAARGVRLGEDEVRFGEVDALGTTLVAIANRSSRLGDLLAEGSRLAAERTGRGSSAWAMHVKGLEMPGYEPRGLKTMALGLAISPRGACHNRSAAYEADFSGAVDRFTAEIGRGRIAADSEDQEAVLDSLILCKFIRKCFDDLYTEAAEMYELVTGRPTTGDDLRKAGERISTLKKQFNVGVGWTRDDDTLPERCLSEPLADGPGAGERLTRAELDLMIGGYYAARGWTESGLVTSERWQALNLDSLCAAPLQAPQAYSRS
jgi:aldehyde:ferredoxin oxidoreductase